MYMGGQVKVCPGGLKIDDGFSTGNGGHGVSRFPESRWRTKTFQIKRTVSIYGYAAAFARNSVRKYSRSVRTTMQSSKGVQKECSDAEPENMLSSRVGQATHLTVCAVLRRLKTQSKATVICLVLRERPVSRDLLSTAQALKTRPAKKVHISFISSATTPGSETRHILG
jgi:hypothetical protein